MKKIIIDKIKKRIKSGDYDLTYHAYEEMAEDGLGIIDIENAIWSGNIIRVEKDDLIGTKYVIRGVGKDSSTKIEIIGRMKETDIFLIITVYVVN